MPFARQEVEKCSYLVQVCSRLLCPHLAQDAEDGGGDGGQSAVAPSGIMDVLDALETCFPVKCVDDAVQPWPPCLAVPVGCRAGDDRSADDWSVGRQRIGLSVGR